MSELKIRCYVCQEPIKQIEESTYIGKDKNGKELRRHRKCSPLGLPKKK